jgi:hypothetical protein
MREALEQFDQAYHHSVGETDLGDKIEAAMIVANVEV